MSQGSKPLRRPAHHACVALVIGLALSAPMTPAWGQTAIGTPPPVVSEIVTPSATPFRAFPGVIRAAREIDLAFLVNGQMATRPVELGQQVEAGEVIATLDQTSLAEDAAAARAAARAADAQAEIAAQTLTRTTALHERGIAPTARLEAARAAAQTTAAAAEAARASVTRAEDAATYAQLTTPEAGIITSLPIEAGASLRAGQPVATLAIAKSREAVIDVPSSYLPLFTPNVALSVASRTEAGVTYKGRLRLIEPVSDARARLHRMRIAIEDSELRLGTLVSVRLESDAADLLTLPPAAILNPQIAPQVWRITDQRRLEAVPVTLGPEIEGRIIITEGISTGDEILIRGINSATEGQTVGARIAP